MKRRICMIITLLAVIITSVNVGFFVKDEFFYSLDDLPEGKLLRNEYNQSILFSTGYLLEIYEISATDEHPAAIRVAARNDTTNHSRTIYWQIGTRESLVYWPEDEENTVYINGVPVNYVNGAYDCRDYHDFTYIPPTDADELKGAF